MMNKTKVTVLVALYNAERYLDRFFQSIRHQSFECFDVIVVDDGSTDSSLAICQKLANSDKRIRVYHKDNGGVSSARNFCLKMLREDGGGEYCIFADPDDWLEPNMLELMYEKIKGEGSDMLICDYFSNENLINNCDPKSLVPTDIINNLLLGMPAYLWNKMIRSKYILDFNFPQNLNYQEDFFAVIELLQKVKIVSYLPKPLYHYCYNKESICNNYSVDFLAASRKLLLDSIRLNYRFLLENWRYDVYEIRIAYHLLICGVMTDDDFRSYFSNLRLSVLLHPHKFFRRSVFVLLVVRGVCTQKFIRNLSNRLSRR